MTMRLICAAVFLFCTTTNGGAQSNTTVGNCSPIVTDNAGAVKIECAGVDPAFQARVVELLNELLKKQIDPQAVMNRLDEISKGVADLDRKAVEASRGIISLYEFNGTKREQRAGHVSVTAGPEIQTFAEIQALYGQKDWRALAEKCDGQIAKTPEWLTPYLFSGIAHANLGEKAAALEKLEFVGKQAGSDPQYADAARIVRLLKAGN